MRNSRMGCLVVLGLLALFVMVFFNGGQRGVPIQSDIENASGGADSADGTSGDSGAGDGLEPLGDLDDEGSGDGSGDDSGVSLDLDGDDSDAGNGSGSDSAGGLGELTEAFETQVSDVKYEVIDAYNQGDNIFDEVMAANGQFVVVTLGLENAGSTPLTYLGANMVDDLGQEYSYIPEAMPYIEEEEVCENITLEPGDSRVCKMVYDIDDDASAVGIVLTDLNLLGGEEETVELPGLP